MHMVSYAHRWEHSSRDKPMILLTLATCINLKSVCNLCRHEPHLHVYPHSAVCHIMP